MLIIHVNWNEQLAKFEDIFPFHVPTVPPDGRVRVAGGPEHLSTTGYAKLTRAMSSVLHNDPPPPNVTLSGAQNTAPLGPEQKHNRSNAGGCTYLFKEGG